MNVLDLFSGIGGFSLGLERAGMRTVAFCEIEDYPRRVLAKHWPDVPIHRDIRELDGTQYQGTVDVVCGGFPCQAFSSAARGRNNAADLWPEYSRVVAEVLPRFVIAENVFNAPWQAVSSDLRDLGYRTEQHDIHIPFRRHKRRRTYLLAYTHTDGEPGRAIYEKVAKLLCDAGTVWPALPVSVGVDDGVPHRVDRLRALGNAVVPQIPEIIGRAIMEAA